MPTIRILLVLMLPALALSCAARPQAGPSAVSDPVSVTDAELAAARSAVVQVHGMACPLCATNVDKLLLAIPGVSGVDMDLGSGNLTLRLTGSPPVTRAAIAAAVHDAGFTLVSIRGN